MPPTLYPHDGGFNSNAASHHSSQQDLRSYSSTVLQNAVSSIAVDVDASMSSNSEYQLPSPGGGDDDDDDMEYDDDDDDDPPYVPHQQQQPPPQKKPRGNDVKIRQNSSKTLQNDTKTLVNQPRTLQNVEIRPTVDIPVPTSWGNNDDSAPPLSPVILDPPTPPEVVRELLSSLPSVPSCPYCGIAFETELGVQRHVLLKHKGDKKVRLTCGVCGKGMRHREGYLRHLWGVHCGGPPSKEFGCCPFCEMKLGSVSAARTLSRVAGHVKGQHPDKKNIVSGILCRTSGTAEDN
jgi:hypothetical protein